MATDVKYKLSLDGIEEAASVHCVSESSKCSERLQNTRSCGVSSVVSVSKVSKEGTLINRQLIQTHNDMPVYAF